MLRILSLVPILALLTSCGTSEQVASLEIAKQINVVTATETEGVSGAGAFLRSFNGPETDYTKDVADFFVRLNSLEPIEQANMILCFMGQLGASDERTLNTGDYLALVDPASRSKFKKMPVVNDLYLETLVIGVLGLKVKILELKAAV